MRSSVAEGMLLTYPVIADEEFHEELSQSTDLPSLKASAC